MRGAIHLSDCRPRLLPPARRSVCLNRAFSVPTVGSMSFQQRFRASTIGKCIHPVLRIHVAFQPLPLTSTFSVTSGNQPDGRAETATEGGSVIIIVSDHVMKLRGRRERHTAESHHQPSNQYGIAIATFFFGGAITMKQLTAFALGISLAIGTATLPLGDDKYKKKQGHRVR